jgi:hypothetical protein
LKPPTSEYIDCCHFVGQNYYGFGLLLAACAAVLRRRFCVAMIAAHQVTQLWAICPLNSTPSSQQHPTPLETSAASCTSKTNMKTIKHMCALGTTYSFIMFHQSISFFLPIIYRKDSHGMTRNHIHSNWL